MDFLETLGKRPLFLDGAMGTMLQKMGHDSGLPGEVLNVKEPQTVLEVQKAYAAAGCDIIEMNTFGANCIKVAKTGLVPPAKASEEAASYIRAAAQIARQAMDEGRPEELKDSFGSGFIALDIGPIGEFIEPFGDLEYSKAYDAFCQMAAAGGDMADLALVETMYDINEAKAALTAVKDTCGLPVVFSTTLSAGGHMLMGGGIPEIVSLAYECGACAVGMNCGNGPEEMLAYLPAFMEECAKQAPAADKVLPVLIMPNAGLPKNIGGVNVYDLSPDDFAAFMKKAADGGAMLLGGCCGTTPDHIRRMTESVRGAF